MDAHEKRLVDWLSKPSSYPHPAGSVQHRETHVSHVFLSGPFAYKLKKPVRFPFLDASTLKRRKRFCELELVLNRRLAPAVYLEAVPVTEKKGGLHFGGKGRVVEWLVKMRRLPEERMLDRFIAKHAVNPADIIHIADRLARFFRKATRSRVIDRYGKPRQVSALVLGNLEECRSFIGSLYSEQDHAFLQGAYQQALLLYEDILEKRVEEKRIIDGHGDIRCENICLSVPVSIFDCVEFQPAFRCGDVANDFGFLIMDLEFRNRPDLARVLEKRYLHHFPDPTFSAVLPLYLCHRSLVRGKVRGFAWKQHPNTKQGRQVKRLAIRHFQLALRYAKKLSPPKLVVVGGLIGTGKSTLAKALSESLQAAWLRTDEIRRAEFEHLRRRNQGFAEGLYAPKVSEQVYQRLIDEAQRRIRQNHSVVCDGTFSKQKGRRTLYRMAQRQGAAFHFFECVTPKAVALKRIANRYAEGIDLSEAKPEHYARLKKDFEPVRGWDKKKWTRLSTQRPPQAACKAAIRALRQAWLRSS